MLHLPFFKKRQEKEPAPVPAQELTEFEQNMKYACEVRSPEGLPVFLARTKEYNDEDKTVQLYSAFGRAVPPVIYHNEYRLVFRVPDSSAPVWHGRVCGSTEDFWKLDCLERMPFDEQRSTFRQTVSLSASVRVKNADGRLDMSTLPDYCQVVDMSLGGMQLVSSHPYQLADHLTVSGIRLHQDPEPFKFSLVVRWAKKGADEYHCGCSFDGIDQKDERRLCAAMYALQRASATGR